MIPIPQQDGETWEHRLFTMHAPQLSRSRLPVGVMTSPVFFLPVTKHATYAWWRGSYERIITVDGEGISTRDASTEKITNRWDWHDVVGCAEEISQYC